VAVEVDVRTHEDRTGAARRSELHEVAAEVSAGLPGDHDVRIVSFDAASGNASVVVSSGAPAEEGRYVRRALDHVQHLAPALGFAPQQAAEFVADPDYQTTSAGAVAVHLRQQYKGLLVYDAAETVRFGADGQLLEVAGRSFTVTDDLAISPAVGPEDAVRAATAHLAAGRIRGGDGDGDGDGRDRDGDGGRDGDGDGGEPRLDQFGEPLGAEPAPDPADVAVRTVTALADHPDRPTVVEATSLERQVFERPVTVSLAWFPLGGTLRLAWHLRLQAVGAPEYRFLVDADDARILLCRQLTRSVGLTGRAQVVLRSGEPRQEVTFPRPLSDFGPPVPADLPPEFPDPWLVDATTSGASVRAINALTGRTVSGNQDGDQVVFIAPTDDRATNQLVVNLFASCSSMHDVLYLVGFREADGNFQRDSLGRGGRPGDAVLARVHPGAVPGTANMSTPADGSPPVMNMGLVTSTGRHTASDPDVVFHEYTHGLTNRLVGGPMNDTALDAEQSSGMGEGWSDYVACTLLDKTVVGDWVVNRPRGIRRQAYTDAFTGTYAELGSAEYSEVHDVGELWCATLMSLGRRLGRWETLQIVVDALKLTAANPSFLAARDAILLAARQFTTARGDGDSGRAAFVASAWTVFTRYGMGPAARTNGASLTGIVADFGTPAPSQLPTSVVQASATPALAIPDADQLGVVSTVQLPDAGPVRGIRVTVDVTHTFRGDLVVTLVTPEGMSAVLHNRTGGGANDLHETYNSAAGDTAGSALRRLIGHPSGGTWALQVSDRAPVDVGRLDAWSLELDVDTPLPADTVVP
jgi:extracellular elastinolytic metalloproteinase